jgi:chromosome segregation ATPase
MLLYEHDGFIEAETTEILKICRSPFAVSFGSDTQNNYELQVSLCDYLDNGEQRCRVAFYAKSLKKALIFSVVGTDKKALWKYGQKTLLELGFQLEDVNLKLSPAMLEVVLRDVPGIASPAEAQLQRTVHQRILADLQATCDKKPESPQGKRAAFKLSTEKRLQEQAGALRELLEALFSTEEEATDEMAALLAQIKDLTVRLEEAENKADSERSQKEISEAITSAAEKRIQELEEVLVDFEKQSSDVLKQKRKVVALNGRIKSLDANLASAQEALAEEQEKQKQFVDEVKSANEQIVALQNELKESEALREEAFALLGEQESKATQLDKSCREAQRRIKDLDRELKTAEQKVDGFSEAVKLSDTLQFQLDKAEEQLNETIALKDSLKEELATAVEKQEILQKSLEEAESLGQANAAKKTDLQELKGLYAELGQENEGLKEELSLALEKHDLLQKGLDEAKSLVQANTAERSKLQETEGRYTELVKMNEKLREEFDQERSVRKSLERGASEDDRRISELEQSLKQAESAAEELRSGQGGTEHESSAALDQEMKALTLRFDQEKAAREALDNDLQKAHKIIDSLEKMVSETKASGLEVNSRDASTEEDDGRVQELEEQLRSLEVQLEREALVKKTLDKELASVEKKLAEQEDSLNETSTVKKGQGVGESAAPVENEKVSKTSKPLPHEVRPAPKKGAFFRPDWDLQGLPCSSTGDVFKAWETAFNVKMAFEGYPSQYCMAFLVVLKQREQKNLYLLYRLRQNKHTLVCIPAKRPKDEGALRKAIKEGLDFLRRSGFEMDEMSAEHIESTLGAYCQDSD